MTFSGEKLSELEPIKPLISPKIETTVSKDYIYDIDVMQLVTSNKDGRMVNDRVIETLWKSNDYISESTYVELGNFTGNADYNLTLSGKHVVDSSTAMQILSGLTLTIIPYFVDQEYDLIYTLENVKTGKTYTSRVNETESMTGWLLFFPAFPFSLIGSMNVIEHLSEHAYQDFVQQGAFGADTAEPSQAATNKTHAKPISIKDEIRNTPTLTQATEAAPAKVPSITPSTSLCIEKVKKSAWYSINTRDINVSYQGEKHIQQMKGLNKKMEASCSEKNS